MNFKYKILQECEGYKVVEFQHSFYDGLKKSFEKQSDKFFKLLNPSSKVKDKYTVIPPQYNHENVKNSMVVQNTIENEALGIIVDDTDENVVFDRISADISNTKNDFCAIKMADTNIIICPDDVQKVNELKKIATKEVLRYKTEHYLDKKDYELLNLSQSEQEYITDLLKEQILDMIEHDIEISEDLVVLTQLNLSKLVVKKRKIQDITKLFELLGIPVFTMDNTFYFSKLDKKNVEEYTEKFYDGQVLLSKDPRLNYDDKTSIHIKPVEKEKHMFKYKDIEEVISSKKDTQKEVTKENEEISINR